MQSLFTIYNPTTRRAVRGVGNARMTGPAAEAAFCRALLACGETLMFDDTCDHGTAYEICDLEVSA